MSRNLSWLMLLSFAFFASFATSASATIVNPNRYVQIESIDFQSSILQLTNFDDINHDLNGWRFCTHDENQVRRYSSSVGLNGVTINAGESLFVHFGNDAVAANEINISTIGGSFASPFDVGPNPGGAYAVGLYVNSNFGSGASLADHIQWSYDGVDNTTADERSDEAEGHVWLDQGDWISVNEDSLSIALKLADFDNEIHSPTNYVVTSVALPDSPDFNENNFVDAADYTVWRDSLGQTGVGLAADGNHDEVVDQADYDLWRDNFGADLTPNDATSTSVPEPTSAMLLATFAIAWCRKLIR